MSFTALLLFITWDVNPGIFPEIEFIRWYGVLWAVGLWLGMHVMNRIYKAEEQSLASLEKLTVYLIIGAIVGARLGHVLFYDFAYYSQHPIEILPIRIEPRFEFTGLSGLASHGGVLGALLTLGLYVKKYRKNFLWILDRVVIAGSLLAGFIRLGNLMNSEIIGTPTDVPWAFVFTGIDNVPRHPAQLYEAIFYFVIFAILYRLWKSQQFTEYTGFLLGLGLSLIFTLRFVIEFVKENQVAFEDGLALNMGQLLSIPLVAVGVVIMWMSRRGRKEINT